MPRLVPKTLLAIPPPRGQWLRSPAKWRRDYGPDGIRVNAVAPGLIETPLTAERIRTEAWRHEIFVEQSPMRRVGQAQDVAQAIAFLASDEAAFISGESLRVDGGWAMGRYPREAQT